MTITKIMNWAYVYCVKSLARLVKVQAISVQAVTHPRLFIYFSKTNVSPNAQLRFRYLVKGAAYIALKIAKPAQKSSIHALHVMVT